MVLKPNYGYSKEEAIGQPVCIQHVPEDTDHITEQVISAVSQFGKWTEEVRMFHKNGHIGWIESMCVPIYDSDEQMVGPLGINRDISDRIKETERLEYLAHYDDLTKISNRNLVLDRVEHLIAKSVRNASNFALLYIDLDNFKTINDSKGHVSDDQVLIETALRLKQAIRKPDTAARIGGDEFLVLMEDISNKDDVSKKVRTLTEALAEKLIIAGEKFAVSYSIAIAIYPENGSTTDALLTLSLPGC